MDCFPIGNVPQIGGLTGRGQDLLRKRPNRAGASPAPTFRLYLPFNGLLSHWQRAPDWRPNRAGASPAPTFRLYLPPRQGALVVALLVAPSFPHAQFALAPASAICHRLRIKFV